MNHQPTVTRKTGARSTRTDRLLAVLKDDDWHATKELIRRVGHTFAGAKFTLVARGYAIERRRHPRKRRQHLYRLVDEPITRS